MKRILLLGVILIIVSVSCLPVGQIVQYLIPESTPTVAADEPAATPAPSTDSPASIPTVTITCDDICLDFCLRQIDENLKTHPFTPLTDYAGTEANIHLAVYDVKDGQLEDPQVLHVPDDYKKYQEDFAAQQRVWNYTVALLPPEQLIWITKYVVFTDGPYNHMAWVASEDLNREKWTLAADIVDSEEPLYLTETLIHEFGHMITLNTDQIPYSELYYGWYQNSAVCPQFLHEAGCTKPESYINLFYQNFWKDILEEWRKTVIDPRSLTREEFQDRINQFYSKHSDLFVREYAATNIEEDMAESFTNFIMEPKPGGKSVIAQKIRFFYDFPELVQLRQRMIQGMCNYKEQ